MHEELSRLLAGELDAEAEAALRARIATEPPLAQAWKRMSALPSLLNALPTDAPPASLMAKLYAMVPEQAPAARSTAEQALDDALAQLAAHPFDSALDASLDASLRAALRDAAALDGAGLDAAPFAPDPREDTIDPEPRAARLSGAPVRLSATRAPARAPERSGSAAPRHDTRRLPVAVGLAALLAVGIVGGGAALLAEPAPRPTLALTSGESVVEGDMDVRAGDLDLHVDGRVRISVTPPVQRVLTDAAGAELVYVPGAERVVARERIRDAASPSAGLVVATSGRADSADDRQDAPETLALVGGSARTADGGGVVTVRVERGDAVVTSGGREVRVTAGEARTFDLGGLPRVTTPFEPVRPAVAEDGPVQPPTRVDEAVVRRDLPFNVATVLTHVAAALDATPSEWPAELDAAWSADEVEALLLDVTDAVPGAQLVDLDCESYPCTAVYTSSTPRGDWMRDVTVAVRDTVPGRAFVETVEGAGGDFLAVAVGPAETTPSLSRLDARMRSTLHQIRRERGH